MEVKLNRSELIKSLSFLSSFTGKASTTPSLQNVQVSCAGDESILKATNIESSAYCRTGGSIVDGGSVLVPYSGLRGFLGSCAAADVRLRSTDKNVIVECGRNRVQFRIDPKADIPAMSFNGEHLFTVPAGDPA